MDDQPRFNENDPRSETAFWDSDIESRTVTVTGFPDEAAQTLRVEDVTLPQLASGIRNQVAASKMRIAVAQAGSVRRQEKRKELPAHQ